MRRICHWLSSGCAEHSSALTHPLRPQSPMPLAGAVSLSACRKADLCAHRRLLKQRPDIGAPVAAYLQMNLGSKSDRRTLSLQQPARAAERSHFPESDLLLALHLHMKARTNRSCKLSIPWGLELSRDASSCGTRGTDQDGLQLLRAYIASISKA